jgi:hypothetical protein
MYLDPAASPFLTRVVLYPGYDDNNILCFFSQGKKKSSTLVPISVNYNCNFKENLAFRAFFTNILLNCSTFLQKIF